MLKETLWTEKYRPTRVADCVLPATVKDTFEKFIATGSLPNLLLTGGPGVGKTTVALAAVEQLNADSLFINASMNGNIDTLRTEVTQFASTVSLKGGRKYVILDEADYLNANSTQPSLRNFIETFSKNCGFILTVNFPNRIITPLRSRLTTVDFDVDASSRPELMAAFMRRAKGVLEAEGVKYEPAAVAGVISTRAPDWRRVLGDLQYFSVRGVIDNAAVVKRKTEVEDLFAVMRTKSFDRILDWLANNAASIDHSTLVRDLYDEAKRCVDRDDLPVLIVILGKYQYQASLVADLEVNTAAMLMEIAAECKFQ